MAADAQYNVLYPSGSQNLLKGNFHLCQGDWSTAISGTAVALITEDYEYKDYHETFYSAVGADNVSADAAAIETIDATPGTTVTCVSGVLDGANVTFSEVDGGSTIRSIVVFQSGSTNGDTIPNVGGDYLLANFTTGSGGEVNIITNGGDITVTWNTDGILNISGGCP